LETPTYSQFDPTPRPLLFSIESDQFAAFESRLPKL
jgi:hypothetical protein